jgi:WD40 repeat protein
VRHTPRGFVRMASTFHDRHGRCAATLVLCAALAAVAVCPAVAADQGKVDRYGDPLPPGAIARLGTMQSVGGDACLFSPDGRMLAVRSGDQGVLLWDVSTGKRIRTLSEFPRAGQMAFSPDGRTLAMAGPPQIRLFDVATGRLAEKIPWRGDVTALSYSSDGGSLLLLTHVPLERPIHGEGTLTTLSRDICRFDLGRREEVFRHTGIGYSARMVVSPNGQTIAVTSKMGLELLHAETGERIVEGSPAEGNILSLQFDADAKRLAAVVDVIAAGRSSNSSRGVVVWDCATGAIASRFGFREQRVVRSDPVFLGDGRLAVSAGTVVEVWDLDAKEAVESFEPTGAQVRNIIPSPDGTQWVVTDSYQMVLWDVVARKVRHRREAHLAGINRVAFAPDGRTVATVASDGTIRLWNAEDGEPVHVHKLRYEAARLVQIEHVTLLDDREFTVAAGNAWLTLHDKIPVATDLLSERPLAGMLPGGRHALAASPQAGFHLLETATGRQLYAITKPAYIPSLALGGDRVAGSGPSGRHPMNVVVWNLWSGAQMASFDPVASLQLERTGRSPFTPQLSPDGTVVAIPGIREGEIDLFEVDTGGHISSLPLALKEQVRYVTYSPDGSILAGMSTNGLILWDAITGVRLAQLVTQHQGWVSSLVFSPDGRLLVTGSLDTTLCK